MTDAEMLWNDFLEEAHSELERLRKSASDPATPDASALRLLAGAMFNVQAGAALVGLDPGAVASGYAEELLIGAAEGRPFGEVRAALAGAARALLAGIDTLKNPDLSGARIENYDAIREATARLAALLPPLPEPGSSPSLPLSPPAVDAGSASASPAVDETLWVPQVDEDMVDPFLEEAAERTDALSQKLLALEASPSDGELVREIFRDLHTIKGSSGFVGLLRMNRLAHAAEDLVGQLRDGTRSVDRASVDALLSALDGLKAILAAASSGAAGSQRMSGVLIDVDVRPYLDQLRAPKPSAPAARAAGLPSATARADEDPAPSPSEVHAAPAPDTTSNTSSNTTPNAAHAGGEAKQTLRVDFDKLDSLLNLVGELVLTKADLHTSVASLSALARELDGQLRRARQLRQPLGARGPEPKEGARVRHGDGDLLEELDRFQRIYSELSSDLQDGAGELDHVSGELRQQVMKLRMLPIGRVFTKYHRTARELAHGLGKQARLELEGAETELDKVLLEQLDDPLLHLVRNALDHGLELPEARIAVGKPPEGVITLSARHRGNQILIEISDDGAGIDPAKLRKKALEKALATEEELAAMDEKQVLDLIFRPGFSTAARVTDLSGRGVGMDVVRSTITRLSGSIEISSSPGHGTTFTLRLPLTLAIIQVLALRVAGEDYALPIDVVERSLHVRPEDIHRVYDRDVLLLPDGTQVPLIWLADVLELGRGVTVDAEVPVVLVNAAGETYGLVVERLAGKREIVLKTLGELLLEVPCAAGATLIGDRVALILDAVQVVQRGLLLGSDPQRRAAPAVAAKKGALTERPRVLIAEDSDVIRESLKRVLEAHGCEVVAARDGAEALALADRAEKSFDLVSTDVMMPTVDGYELTRALRAHPRHKDVPIVMVTSRSEHIDRVRGFDAGVDEYLTKPIDSGELFRALERHLGKRGRPA